MALARLSIESWLSEMSVCAFAFSVTVLLIELFLLFHSAIGDFNCFALVYGRIGIIKRGSLTNGRDFGDCLF